MRTKPPNEVVWFRNRFDSHSTNRFRCGHSESGFAPRLHLVYTFECASMRIAFASVDRPKQSTDDIESTTDTTAVSVDVALLYEDQSNKDSENFRLYDD